MAALGREASPRIATDAHGRVVKQTPFSKLKERRLRAAVIPFDHRLSLFDAALCGEINCEAPEPVATLVMLAGDRCEASMAMRFCRPRQRRAAGIISGQGRKNTFQHPCPAQV